MSDFELKSRTITEVMKSEANDIAKYMKYSYKEDKRKIGRIRIEYEFEEYYHGTSYKDEKGVMHYTSMRDETKPPIFELVLMVYVPLLGMSFTATDCHKYRWNERRQMFEFEECEIR